jgi:hypothetical protein
MANEGKQIFGSTTTVISHAAALSNAAFTYSGLTGCTMLQLDNSAAAYPWAQAVLNVPDTFAAAPGAGGYVSLYACKEDVDGSSDDVPAPDSGGLKAAQLMGYFMIPAFDVATRVTITVDISGFLKSSWFIYNACGQALSYSSNPITVKLTPFTVGPA